MRRGSMTLVAGGLALIVGAPAVWVTTRPAATVGDTTALLGGPGIEVRQSASAAMPAASTDLTGDPAAPASGRAAPTTPASASWQGQRRAGTPAATAGRSNIPARIAIPALGLDVPIVAVGVDPNGEMEIPDDVATAGWYRHGPSPGQPGSAVVAGHVDSRVQGPGPFLRLSDLEPGTPVHVTYEDGTRRAFEVVARQRIDKAAVPWDAVFARGGEPRLTLITCGGRFDRAAGTYRSNVIVTAVPLDGP